MPSCAPPMVALPCETEATPFSRDTPALCGGLATDGHPPPVTGPGR